MPQVSVIIPTYNRSELLCRAIDSVLNQQFGDFELIIVNDGSTDDTQLKLADYTDPRIRLIDFPHNRGIGSARYAGVALACGKWIAFLDADDIWLSGKLYRDQELLSRYPTIDILFDNYRNINYLENSTRSGFDQTRLAFAQLEIIELEEGVFQVLSGFAEAILMANLIGTASVVTVRREVFEKIGNFDVALSGPEDFELFWRAALAGMVFAFQERVLVERHKDEESITACTCSFAPRLLQAYDLCEASLEKYRRLDLLGRLNNARCRTWQSLIHAYALEGQRGKALFAFRSSLRYGFSRGACVYLLAALAGPHAISLAKKLLKT